MRKAFAEIIAGVIPRKMARNRWRGILRYGLIKAIKLKWKLRRDKGMPTTFLAICAIAKNEGPYFKEWIEWHLSIGVEKFYIYDNESVDETRRVLEPYIKKGIVEYNYVPGFQKQLPVYDDCIERHRLDTRWLAFIDIDEFMVPVKDESLSVFLERFDEASVVEVNWLIYGSGGAKKKEDGGVMERFKRHSRPEHILNRHVKSIVNPKRVYNMIGCHEAARITGSAYDSHGHVIKQNFRDREPQQDVIRINHYAVKSYEEFLGKRARGRARGKIKNRIRGLEYFDRFDLNDLP